MSFIAIALDLIKGTALAPDFYAENTPEFDAAFLALDAAADEVLTLKLEASRLFVPGASFGVQPLAYRKVELALLAAEEKFAKLDEVVKTIAAEQRA